MKKLCDSSEDRHEYTVFQYKGSHAERSEKKAVKLTTKTELSDTSWSSSGCAR